MAKIIDITNRLSKKSTHSVDAHNSNKAMTDVIPFYKPEDKKVTGFTPILLKERRQVDRTILSELVSGCIVLPKMGLIKVELYDISEDGMSFELDQNFGSFKVGDEVALRVYLNKKVYFPLLVTIKHVTKDTHSVLSRHGAEYLKGANQDSTIKHFLNFILSVSEGIKLDEGDYFSGPKIS